ncbi:hypothetical protein B0H66DRAFT_54314 [Apodospora peruviana]|uniref:Uncharacterized protein n=1 Tax=Apodospora peruviana TaxID=516989 RepID=A0AAE0MF52_9PEZI|nr:hypothetical protein B0H66DRAFT_54314 [Apodospora peruviana]
MVLLWSRKKRWIVLFMRWTCVQIPGESWFIVEAEELRTSYSIWRLHALRCKSGSFASESWLKACKASSIMF